MTKAGAESDQGPALVGRRRALTVAALTLASFLLVFNDSAVSIALPAVLGDLAVELGSLQWILNAYTLALAAVLLPSGRLVDRYGARRPMMVGVGVFLVASLFAAVAPGGGLLVAARAVQGVGAGLMAPAALTAVSQLFPPNRRAFGIGIWAGFSSLGLGAGPLLGGLLVEGLGWRSIFVINVLAGIVLLVILQRWLHTVPAARHQRLDVTGAVLSAAALVLLIFGLTRGADAGWLSPLVVMLLLAAAASLVLFAIIERRVASPLVDLAVFRSRELSGATVVGLLSTAAMCSVLFFVSLYLQVAAGYSTLETGVVFLPMTIIVVAVAPLAGWLTSKIGPRPLLVVGMALLAAAMVLLSRLDQGLGVSGIAAGLAFAGLGVAMTAAPVTAASLDALPESHQGLGSAIVNASRSVGLALGVAVMGTIVVSYDPALLPGRLSNGLLINAGIALITGAIAFVAFGHPRIGSGPAATDSLATGSEPPAQTAGSRGDPPIPAVRSRDANAVHTPPRRA